MMSTDPPPMNQLALYSTYSLRSSGSDDDLEEEEERLIDDVAMTELTNNDDSPPVSAFRIWFDNDKHVAPEKQIAYLMMMMSSIDDTFSWEAPPYDSVPKKAVLRPTLKLYQKEVQRRAALVGKKFGVSNKKLEDLAAALKGPYRLSDEEFCFPQHVPCIRDV